MADDFTPDEALRRRYREATPVSTPAGGHLDDATWERLACHELTTFERQAVMDHIADCSACAQVWRGLRELETGARRLDPGVPGAGPVERTRRAGWLLGRPAGHLAAAVAVMALAGVIGYGILVAPEPSGPDRPPGTTGTPSPAHLAAFPLTKADLHVSPDDALVFRGGASRTEPPLDDLGAALEPYRRDDFGAAASRLEPLRTTYPTSARVGLYLGVSYLFLDRAEDAVAPLETAAGGERAEVAADGRWYLAVACARTGRLDRARGLVTELCAADGPEAGRACAARDVLRDVSR